MMSGLHHGLPSFTLHQYRCLFICLGAAPDHETPLLGLLTLRLRRFIVRGVA